MKNLLFIQSSFAGASAQSRNVAIELINNWLRHNPSGRVVERQLNAASFPHITQEAFTAGLTPASVRTQHQEVLAALGDAVIEEAEAADVIVIAAPMYNFSIPSTLKSWIDHLARAGRTFRYGANGPEGQLKGKKVYIVASRGGAYTGDSPAKGMDFQEPYLRAVLGFLGLTDVDFIHVERQGMGPEAAAAGLEAARAQIVSLSLAHAA